MREHRIPEDAHELAAYLSISLTQLTNAVQPVHQGDGPGDVPSKTSIAPILRILEVAESALGDGESVRTWLNRPVPELEDESPLAVILAGEAGAVATLLDNVRGGIPG